MVMGCVPSSLHVLAHKAEANCLPWSIREDGQTAKSGHPRAHQGLYAARHFHVAGLPSSHLVDLSTMMNWYWYPSSDVSHQVHVHVGESGRWYRNGLDCLATLAAWHA
jgi:hypothetical protein